MEEVGDRRVSALDALQKAQALKDVAHLLGFKPSSLAYVLYKMPDATKYTCFDLPKRDGDTRKIKAPAPQLGLLQRRLANVLYDCVSEIERTSGRRSLAHAFAPGRSIVTNAHIHKRRRYVLNLDLSAFFPSLNFGRIRGFFIKDKHFRLHPKVATIITQIASHDNELPQGSPCSPVISNLIAHLLDIRLARMAKANKVTYSRYADDITFSTNQKQFPEALAARATPHVWQLGSPLVATIERSGFQINHAKTRMQCRGSRQVVTGLMVNQKINIRQEYYRTTRAMCHELFATGSYYRVLPAALVGGAKKDDPIKVDATSLDQLEGTLAYIYYVKNRAGSSATIDNK